MRRLVAAGLLLEQVDHPVKAMVHVSLAELRPVGDSALEGQEIAGPTVRPARQVRGATIGQD
jgi:hypothetical protein